MEENRLVAMGETVRKAPVQPIQPLSECCGRPIVSKKIDFSDGLGGVNLVLRIWMPLSVWEYCW